MFIPDFESPPSPEGGHLLFHRAGHDASGHAPAALGDGAGPESPGIAQDEKKEDIVLSGALTSQ